MRHHFAAAVLLLLAALPVMASITGTVMDPDGKPVLGAGVAMYALETPEAARVRLLSTSPERRPLAETSSDAKGRFAFESPKEAVVQLVVRAAGYAPWSARTERDDDTGGIPLRRADMKSGKITAAGKPVAGALVVWSGAGEVLARTDEQGRYSAPDPSKWAGGITVIHPDYAILDEPASRMTPWAVSIDRALTAGKPLSGKVVSQDGKTAVTGAAITLDDWPLATSREDGSFTIPHAGDQWKVVTARTSDRLGSRVRSASTTVIRLGPAGTLSGSVRNLKTGAPLAAADVRIRRNNRFDSSSTVTALSDAKGYFALTGVAAGTYEIVGTRPGYTIAPMSVSLLEGAKLSRTLLATELGRISGTVIDEQKHGVPHAAITSRNLTSRNVMFEPPMTSPDASSAPDGTFVIRVNPDSDLELSATRKGYPSARSATLRLGPGERRGGITLTIPDGTPVTGRVTDAEGKPLAGVAVEASESNPNAGAFMIQRMAFGGPRLRDDALKTSADGTFSLRLKDGSYDFGFRLEGFASKVVRAVSVSSAAKPLEITLQPGVAITGRVTRGGVGVPEVRLVSFGDAASALGETGADGSFRLTDLAPGPMRLSISKPDEFIQQVKMVTAPATDVVIEVPQGGRISGHVVDKSTHQPVTAFEAGVGAPRGGGGFVMMMPTSMRPFTSDDGSFVLENVPPGPTQLTVNAAGYTASHMPNLTVEAGKTLADVTVEMDRGVRLVGHVTGPDGSALGGVSVRPDPMAGRMIRVPGSEPATTTDENGDYSMDALEPGDRTMVFSLPGYVSEQKTVSLTGDEVRLDVRLSTGMQVSGSVATDAGVPVGDASVFAMSASQPNAASHTARTDPNGNFTIEGLAPGRYTFTARKSGYPSGDLRDFDISSGAPARITLHSAGVVYGQVSGLPPDELQQVIVMASASGSGGSAAVDTTGNYRIEGAPTGTVRVSARTGSGITGGRSSAVQSVQVDPGSEVKVDIVFKNDTVIHGRITRSGQPVDGAMVSFFPRNAQAQTTARTSANSNGEYQVSGLDDANYEVTVVDLQRSAPFATTYQVHGSGTFDVDMKSAMLRGRVTSSKGDPVADATIEVRESSEAGLRFALRSAQTDASGAFTIDGVPPGTYGISASKPGYGTKVVQSTVGDNGGEVEITLSENSGVLLTVVDGRDRRPISAYVRVSDMQGKFVYDTPRFGGGGAEPLNLPLEPGTYRASIMAYGYAPQTVNLTSPSSPTIALTPGGSIAVQSKGSQLRRGRPMGIDGREYAGAGGAGLFTIDPSPGITILNNIAPGTYTLQILGPGGEVTASAPVTVTEGQQAQVKL